MNLLQNIGKVIVAAGMLVGSWFGYHAQPQLLGVTVNKPVPRFESSLAIAINATATSSLTMVSGVDGNGVALSGPMCFTIDGGTTSLVEDVCGTASGTVVSNLSRGVSSDGTTLTPSLAHAHRVGADIKTTDSPYLVQYYRLLNGIDGLPNPLIYASNVTNASITANNANLVDYALLASTSFAGTVNGSTLQKGIFQQATTSQLLIGSSTGSTGAVLVVGAGNVNQSSTANAIPIADANGNLDPNYIKQGSSSNYSFGTVAVSTTTVTSSAVFGTSSTVTLNGTTTASGSFAFATTPIQTARINSQLFTTTLNTATTSVTSTWTVPSGITKVWVTMVGGGGGSGAGHSSTNSGGGGGSGGVCLDTVTSTTPGTSISITVGGGGVGTSTTDGNGTAGSASVFGGLTAGGGGLGTGGTGGGQGSAGSAGANCVGPSALLQTAALGGGVSRTGGGNLFGSGGGGDSVGTGYGAGGGGGNVNVAGSNGTAGFVLIQW